MKSKDAHVRAAGRGGVLRLGRALLAALLALAAGGFVAGLAQAHALLVRSVPEADADLAQAPGSVEMWFSEPLEPGFSGSRLLDSTGAEVRAGAVVIDAADPAHMTLLVGRLEPGIYTVAWQTLSQVDGHEWYGSFPFTVLNPDGSRPAGAAATVAAAGRGELPTVGEALFRWLSLLGGVLLLGAPLFHRLIVSGAAASRDGEAASLESRSGALALRAVWVAALAVILGNGLQITLQALRLEGSGQLPDLLVGTRIGALALARQLLAAACLLVAFTLPQPRPLKGRESAFSTAALVLAAGLMLLLGAASLRGHGDVVVPAALATILGAGFTAWWPSARVGRRAWEVLIGLAAAALLAYSAGSHAGAVPGSLWATLGDYVHLLAASAWVGGLLLLPILLWQARRGPAPAQADEDQHQLVLVVRRFSFLASFSVYVLALTGLFNSLVQLPDLASLVASAYGRVLLLKLALIVLALGIAFLNNRLVHRKAQRLDERSRLRLLNRQVLGEAGLALAIMLSVAVLVQTPSPRAVTASNIESTQPFSSILSGGDLDMHVRVTPKQVGTNRFWLHLFTPDGAPLGEVQLVRLIFQYRDAQLGQATVDLERTAEGIYETEGAFLSQAGSWDVSVYVRRRGKDDILVPFSLDVAPFTAQAGAQARSRVQIPVAAQNPVPGLPAAFVLSAALLGLGLIPLVWRRPLQAAGSRLYSLARRLGGLLLVLAFLLSIAASPAVRARLGIAQSPDDLQNPIPATAASIEQGRALYQANCLPCHGPTGLGDGPVGLTLSPRPANLQQHMVPGVHSDGQLYEWITNGYPGSAMPAFKESLADEERWHVLNYIRTLVPQAQ